jgi:hypothetical protein
MMAVSTRVLVFRERSLRPWRGTLARSVLVVLCLAAPPASAQSEMFTRDDLKMSFRLNALEKAAPKRKPFLNIQPARQYQVRTGYTFMLASDKHKYDVKDVSGPIVPYGTTVPGSPNYVDWTSHGGPPLAWQVIDGAPPTLLGLTVPPPFSYLTQATLGIKADHPANPQDYGLGAPVGFQAQAKSTGTPTVSVLAFLDEYHEWGVETFVLAIPPTIKIYGAGRVGGSSDYPGLFSSGPAWGASLDLGRIFTTKVLPATVILHRYFGDKDDEFRVSAGVAATYAIFFGSKADNSVNDYAGGYTRIRIKNAFCMGPAIGVTYALNDRWSLNATAAFMKLKTRSTLRTQNDPLRLAASYVVEQSARDVGPATLLAVMIGRGITIPGTSTTLVEQGLTKLALATTGDPRYLGTSVRTLDSSIDLTVLNMSVGYSF